MFGVSDQSGASDEACWQCGCFVTHSRGTVWSSPREHSATHQEPGYNGFKPEWLRAPLLTLPSLLTPLTSETRCIVSFVCPPSLRRLVQFVINDRRDIKYAVDKSSSKKPISNYRRAVRSYALIPYNCKQQHGDRANWAALCRLLSVFHKYDIHSLVPMPSTQCYLDR